MTNNILHDDWWIIGTDTSGEFSCSFIKCHYQWTKPSNNNPWEPLSELHKELVGKYNEQLKIIYVVI